MSDRRRAIRPEWPVVWTVFALLLASSLSFAQGDPSSRVDARAQEKATALLQRVMDQYWNNGGAKLTGETNAPGSETNVEAAFRAAIPLVPDRLDLRFGLASTLVSQAVQTNGAQLTRKMNEALDVYRQIDALDTNGFEALLLIAAYARVLGRTNDYQETLTRLTASYPERSAEYVRRFDRLDEILSSSPAEIPDRTIPKAATHVIVVLGAGLETNGTAKVKLIGRLEQCLRVARIYKHAVIILTGGNPRGGVTEAYAMREWLLNKGISKRRLYMEDEAHDTVENALFVSALLRKLAVTDVTVVTSASHVRRGVADLDEACRMKNLNVRFHPLASRTKGEKAIDPMQERLGVYRDVLRLSGLWAFPGIRR